MYGGISAIGWLDTNDQQTRRMREIIAGMDDKEALDPLGLGAIRDAFAERLFPGTSTVQTRLRYFLFVPWIFQDLERTPPDRQRFDQQLRSRELRLIETLRESEGAGVGVIGYRARQRVTRLPSAIYWYGLGAWGIRVDGRATLNQYRDVLTRRNAGPRRDLDSDVVAAPRLHWDLGVPPIPSGFPDDDTNLQLTSSEAEYLQHQMTQTRLGMIGNEEQPSLLAIIAGNPDRWSGAKAPWEMSIGDLAQPVSELLRHGQLFSLVTYGAQLLYNTLLCDAGERRCGIASDELAAQLHDYLAEWAQTMTEFDANLTEWWSRPNEFWSVVNRAGARVRPTTQRFLDTWISAAIRDPGGAVTDPASAATVTAQEQYLKGRYARLTNLAALQTWRGEPLGATPQRYRWPTVRRLVTDLHDGLTAGDSDARA